ncbi:NAD-dependent epimerase/dehydratase family protein [Frigoribacterium sp. 2-23]|uniref:NAD-dependent epimerase/dehydratase family protein n=1 Tax=Frigoribacterium sp. 2-23 TaxID=3415006 RepID=UPI003C7055A1
MRVFVAGGSGVLGRAVVPQLVELGHDVVATSRAAERMSSLEELGATAVLMDAFDREATFEALSRCEPEAVLHLMTDLGTGNSASNARLRSVGTRNLVDAAQAAGVGVFVGQSISWVYPPGSTSATEDDELDLAAAEPRRTTVAAVRELESAVLECARGVVLRFGQLYGAGTWYSKDGRFGDAARASELSATETVTSFVNVDDAAAALVEALDWPAGVWNIVDDEPAAGVDWAPAFATAVGAPAPAAHQSGDIGRAVSHDRARGQGLVLRYPSWRSGFRDL